VTTDDPHDGATIAHLLRDLAPQVLGAIARRQGDFAAAEDAVQEALIAAARQWPANGIPANPGGWLHHVALRRLTDRLRAEMARRRREDAVAEAMWADWAFVPPPDAEIGAERDDTLVLLFMCCHPALTAPSAIALTLRAVGGLTTGEVASAFLVPEATMAQRISRAKQTIRSSGIPFALPSDGERRARLGAVLHVLYLIFNEGYTTSAGESLHRTDLSGEAIRLARTLRALLPDDPSAGSGEAGEVAGLLALMLLTDARRAARVGPSGELIPLDEQDRSRWDRGLIAEGVALVEGALARGSVGPYQLQAAIAAVHDEAARAEETDWPQILALYEVLEGMSSNPMVSLNRAVAAAMVHGPATGLALVDALDAEGRLGAHHRLDAVRAHLHEMLGERDRAIADYRAAADRRASIPERDDLMARAARLAVEARADERAEGATPR
jgi:RNA polymerase sigma factor (sigma-70 family)